jgi:hypothetical protein
MIEITLTERERDLLLDALSHPRNTWMIELSYSEWRAVVVKLGGLPEHDEVWKVAKHGR